MTTITLLKNFLSLYGFCDKNRRVRAQSFRGARSEGFWLPISSLNVSGITNVPYDTFPVGAAIDDGAICNKYLTPKTANKRTNNAQSRGSKGELKGFPKHYDTKQFRYEVDQIPVGSIVYITEKLHGTSHRVGSVRSENPTRWYHKLFRPSPRMGYQVEHGTRNVLLGHGTGAGYYGSDQFRLNALAGIDAKLRKGEVVYGELVGFHDFAHPIMPRVNMPKDLPEILQKYGEQITYTYGCHEIQCEFYAYRIVHFNEDGHGTELAWTQVKHRCEQLGLKTVPEIVDHPIVLTDRDELQHWVEFMVDGPSLLDATHLREGVCVRIETPNGHIYTLKHKSFAFKVLEGIIKLEDSVEDMEEAA